jgi:hypothetical protein
MVSRFISFFFAFRFTHVEVKKKGSSVAEIESNPLVNFSRADFNFILHISSPA